MQRIHWHDILNFAGKLTAKKILNALQVWSSYRLSRLLRKPIQWGYPIAVAFEPTTSCNLRCPECPSGLRSFTRPTGMLEKNFFQETIDSIQATCCYLTFYFQGEPYLHPEFLEMVRYAAREKIYTATSTNAHYLTDEKARETVESGLDRLIISIDGTTQETYQQYRVGGQLDKVIEGTKKLVEWKRKLNSRKPFLVFQFLVVKPNEHQVEEVKQLAKKIGVDDVWFKSAQVYDYQTDPNGLIPSNNRYSRYKKDADGNYQPKHPLSHHCWKLWHSNVITWDGKVVPCCFDKDAEHQLGDLRADSMQNIWKNKKYQQFRQQLTMGRKNIDICSNCSEGLKVWQD
ncbi:MAG: SPASM domain-containing protein [Bacteroidetes bacterium]|nr:SPASM domain-containing protein [Bacteroidota bacterium]